MYVFVDTDNLSEIVHSVSQNKCNMFLNKSKREPVRKQDRSAATVTLRVRVCDDGTL